MAISINRTGRVSSVDYASGTFEVTYFDRGKSVTQRIPAISNGEYKMPKVGQVVSVYHQSNGPAAAVSGGTIWNNTNRPAEGFKGLYRKEFGEFKGQSYERFDANTGEYATYVPSRIKRICKGEIYDEAEGPVTVRGGGQVQIISAGGSASIQAHTGVGITAGTAVSIEADTDVSVEAAAEMSIKSGGKTSQEAGGNYELKVKGKTTRKLTGDVKDEAEGKVEKKIGGDLTADFGGKIDITGSGEVTIDINGATITIGAGGEIGVESPVEITLKAPTINVEADDGDAKIKTISLVKHKHENGGAGKPEQS